jgi:hypothetical protein
MFPAGPVQDILPAVACARRSGCRVCFHRGFRAPLTSAGENDRAGPAAQAGEHSAGSLRDLRRPVRVRCRKPATMGGRMKETVDTGHPCRRRAVALRSSSVRAVPRDRGRWYRKGAQHRDRSSGGALRDVSVSSHKFAGVLDCVSGSYRDAATPPGRPTRRNIGRNEPQPLC